MVHHKDTENIEVAQTIWRICMLRRTTSILALVLLAAQLAAIRSLGQAVVATPAESAKIETSYDAEKDKTTVRLASMQISGEQGKYKSLHMSPSFSYPGIQVATPAIVDFELQTVVKGRLRTDLYVLFIIDGEKVHLSSSRWAVKRPVPGRVWVGERLVFRMPYETFVKITQAKTVEIKFDAITFAVGDTQLQALRELLTYMRPGNAGE
jgi:hypothetical protein